MSADTNVTPNIVVNEPLAIAALVRAALYSFLLQRGMDTALVGLICTISEAALTIVTRRLVTPVHRAESNVAAAVAEATAEERTTV
jgi:hypothetical protein